MKQIRNDTYQSGLAAEYLITSCLIRLGLEAYITTGNRKKTDIRVVSSRTNKSCSIDVKAVRGYSSVVVNNVVAESGHFIVFVIFNDKIETPEILPSIYITPSEDVSSITSKFKEEYRVMKRALEPYKSQWKFIQDYIS
jgi:hypothetical protein